MTKRELFGGTLFSAGLAAAMTSTVSAGNTTFPFDPGVTNEIAAGYLHFGAHPQAYEIGPNGTPAGPLNFSHTDDLGNTMSAYGIVSDTLMHVEAQGSAQWLIDGPGYDYFADVGVFIDAFCQLTPGSDLLLHLSWSTESDEGGGVLIRNMNTNMIEVDPQGMAIGDLTHLLQAGVTYRVILSAYTDAGEDDSSWAQVVIVPAPGVVALLGCALVIGKRRRRT